MVYSNDSLVLGKDPYNIAAVHDLDNFVGSTRFYEVPFARFLEFRVPKIQEAQKTNSNIAANFISMITKKSSIKD